jgi:hypothetical protein
MYHVINRKPVCSEAESLDNTLLLTHFEILERGQHAIHHYRVRNGIEYERSGGHSILTHAQCDMKSHDTV